MRLKWPFSPKATSSSGTIGSDVFWELVGVLDLGCRESVPYLSRCKPARYARKGTFGEVKQALWISHEPPLEVAIKIIRKKSVKGQERIVYDEMEVLKELDHVNIGAYLFSTSCLALMFSSSMHISQVPCRSARYSRNSS